MLDVIEEADALLEQVGFDPDENVLTRRQAQVLVLRERDVPQAAIADALGTSRANISSLESSARENVEKSRETVALADALTAPVRVCVPAGTELYDVPEMVYDACDEVGLKVGYSGPAFIRLITDATAGSISDRQLETEIVVSVTTDGTVRVHGSA